MSLCSLVSRPSHCTASFFWLCKHSGLQSLDKDYKKRPLKINFPCYRSRHWCYQAFPFCCWKLCKWSKLDSGKMMLASSHYIAHSLWGSLADELPVPLVSHPGRSLNENVSPTNGLGMTTSKLFPSLPQHGLAHWHQKGCLEPIYQCYKTDQSKTKTNISNILQKRLKAKHNLNQTEDTQNTWQ